MTKTIETVRDLDMRVEWIATGRQGLIIDTIRAGGLGCIHEVEFELENGEVETRMIHDSHLVLLDR